MASITPPDTPRRDQQFLSPPRSAQLPTQKTPSPHKKNRPWTTPDNQRLTSPDRVHYLENWTHSPEKGDDLLKNAETIARIGGSITLLPSGKARQHLKRIHAENLKPEENRWSISTPEGSRYHYTHRPSKKDGRHSLVPLKFEDHCPKDVVEISFQKLTELSELFRQELPPDGRTERHLTTFLKNKTSHHPLEKHAPHQPVEKKEE